VVRHLSNLPFPAQLARNTRARALCSGLRRRIRSRISALNLTFLRRRRRRRLDPFALPFAQVARIASRRSIQRPRRTDRLTTFVVCATDRAVPSVPNLFESLGNHSKRGFLKSMRDQVWSNMNFRSWWAECPTRIARSRGTLCTYKFQVSRLRSPPGCVRNIRLDSPPLPNRSRLWCGHQFDSFSAHSDETDPEGLRRRVCVCVFAKME
jgi:hypothetical protein